MSTPIKIRLEQIVSVPFPVMLIIFCLAIAGLLFWWFLTSRAFGDLILFLTLIILILYTYYTLQVVRATYRGPALLHVQIEHSDTIKLFLRKWLNKIKLPIIYYDPNGNAFEFINKCNLLEEDWQYRDLLDHHLPESYKDLQEDWEMFKELVTIRATKADKFNGLIIEEIDAILTEIKSKDSNISSDEREIKLFADKIFEREVRNDYDLGDTTLNVKKLRDESYQLIAIPGIYSSKIVLLVGPREEMESAKTKIEKIADITYIEEKFSSHIKEIKECESKLKSEKNRLQKKIEGLIKWTLLPGTSCDRLKDFEIKS